jgi:hypothetical protein
VSLTEKYIPDDPESPMIPLMGGLIAENDGVGYEKTFLVKHVEALQRKLATLRFVPTPLPQVPPNLVLYLTNSLH